MKRLFIILLVLFLSPIVPIAADEGNPNLMTATPNPNTDNMGSDMADLVRYLLALGGYMGYNLKIDPPEVPKDPFIRTLLEVADVKSLSTASINSFLGALPVNSLVPQFLPDDTEGSKNFNPFANATFKGVPFNSPNQDNISVNESVDQKKYQQDPVNQSIVNILSTVDPRFCSRDLVQSQLEKCGLLYPNKILASVVGKLPISTASTENAFYGPNYVQGFLSQLNSNSLLGPLQYAVKASGESNEKEQNGGLTATTQATQAENFIRYVSGLLLPAKPVPFDDYDTLFTNADFDDKTVIDPTSKTAKAEAEAKANAREILNGYFVSLRTYSAQVSAGVGNLYYILSKRMSQPMPDKKTSSQAQNEFTMATRRLFLTPPDPNKPPDPNNPNAGKPWIEAINNASASTIQKEIAVLLAEINYQLYLNRQQDERLLMTQSILLLQGLKPPNGNLMNRLANKTS